GFASLFEMCWGMDGLNGQRCFGLDLAGHRALGILWFLGGNITGGLVGPAAEEMLLHLLFQVLACLGIGQVESVLVDQRLLMLQPSVPRLRGNVFVDSPT